MTGNTTKPTGVAVDEFIASVADERKQADARELVALMSELTGQPATMWGPSLIGFGEYTYKYPSGREGTWAIVSFSPRKANITLYLMDELENKADLLAKFGKHTTGKGCIYIKKLDDIDRDVLRQLISRSLEHMRAQYPGSRG